MGRRDGGESEGTAVPGGRRAPHRGVRGATAQALANAEAREELASSRARIVEAGDAARRRIERDLHDGAQQRLVALALTLRRARALLESDPAAARAALAEATESLDQALAELRELARGIHPAV